MQKFFDLDDNYKDFKLYDNFFITWHEMRDHFFIDEIKPGFNENFINWRTLIWRTLIDLKYTRQFNSLTAQFSYKLKFKINIHFNFYETAVIIFSRVKLMLITDTISCRVDYYYWLWYMFLCLEIFVGDRKFKYVYQVCLSSIIIKLSFIFFRKNKNLN